MISKSELLSDLRNGGIRYESSIPSETRFACTANTAVVTKISTDKTSYSGQPGGGKTLSTLSSKTSLRRSMSVMGIFQQLR